MSSRSARFALVAVLAALCVAAPASAPGAEAPASAPSGSNAAGDPSLRPVQRTCGILPGDGAFSYIRTVGIKCRAAIKIAFRAQRRFCSFRNDCTFGFPPKFGRVYKGAVKYSGWQCLVRKAYELSRTVCAKDGMAFDRRSGA